MSNEFYAALFTLFSIAIAMMIALTPILVILWWLRKVRDATIRLFTPRKK